MSSHDYFYFDSKKLQDKALVNKDQYASASPFPHVVLDGFLPEDELDRVLVEFPNPTEIHWNEYTNEKTENKKLSCEDETQMGSHTRHLLSQFNSSTFVSFLEKLTGITGLIPDPHYRGGGLHQTKQGGFLGVHADFNRYKRLSLDRRLNLLVYLNKDWKEEYGGHLELWSKDMKACEKKVLPVFNRAVLFSTTDNANHGHPEPLSCPEDSTRKSLALYYYTNGMPEDDESAPHTTLFKDRPDTKRQRLTLKKIVKKLLPPIFIEFVRWTRNSR